MEAARTRDAFDRALRDENPVVRAFAVCVLAEMPGAEGRGMFEALAGHPDVRVRRLAAARMREDGHAVYGPALRRLAADPDADVREAALEGLVGDPSPEVTRLAITSAALRMAGAGSTRFARYPVPEARVVSSAVRASPTDAEARDALATWHRAQCSPPPSDPGGRAACGALAALSWCAGVAAAKTCVDQGLADVEGGVRAAALEALSWRPSDEAIDAAARAAYDGEPQVRLAAVRVLGACDPKTPRALDPLRAIARRDPDPMLQAHAARELPAGDPVAVEALRDALDRVGIPFDAEIAAALAARGAPDGMAWLRRAALNPMRSDGARASRLLDMFPYVSALAGVSSPEARAVLRRLRSAPSEEGLAAWFALAASGDREVPAYARDAISGTLGLDAQLLALLATAWIQAPTTRPP